jgi:hypothetical protein
MHAEGVGGFRDAAVGAAEDARDEALLELVERVLEEDAAIHHLLDESLEPFGNHRRNGRPRRGPAYSSSRPVRRRYASTYFSRVFSTTSSGNEGTGGCLFQRIFSR